VLHRRKGQREDVPWVRCEFKEVQQGKTESKWVYCKSNLCSTNNYTVKDLEFSVIDALRGLQAAQKRHVEITTQQGVLSEERHTSLMQGLREATGKMTLLSQKVENLTNVMLQSYGGLPVQVPNQTLPDFSYLVNPPDPSFL
jgi:hypothetical protein